MHLGKIILTIALICASISGGLALASNSESIATSSNETLTMADGPLDGLKFRGAIGLDGKAKDIPDLFVFEDGNFVSKECELRCKYPARPYFVRKVDNKTEFISETRCPYKDAAIIWRGTIEGDTIRGKSTWIVKRWYWTLEDTFEFEGKLIKPSPATDSTN